MENSLTKRQVDVVELLAKGLTNQEIGHVLDLSPGTVKVHVSGIIERLDVTNRTEAATAWAQGRIGAHLSVYEAPEPSAVCILPFRTDDEDARPRLLALRSGLEKILTRNGMRVIDQETSAHLADLKGLGSLPRDRLGISLVVSCSLEGQVVVMQVKDIDGEQIQSCKIDLFTALGDAVAAMSQPVLEAFRGDPGQTHGPLGPSLDDAYWQGCYLFAKRSPEALLASVERFEEAIATSPDNPAGYVGLSNASHQIGFYGEAMQSFFFDKGRQAAERAVELSPLSAEANTSLAYSKLFRDWDFDGARDSFRTARQLDPRYPEARMWSSLLQLLLGNFEEALELGQEGLSYNPLSVPHFVHIGHVFRSAGRYREALEHLNFAATLEPNNIRGQIWLALTHAEVGQFDLAETYAQQILSVHGRRATLLGIAGYIAGLKGDKDAARALHAEIADLPFAEQFARLYIAMVEIGMGDLDAAIHSCNMALPSRPPLLLGLWSDPIFRRLESVEGYGELADSIGLRQVAQFADNHRS